MNIRNDHGENAPGKDRESNRRRISGIGIMTAHRPQLLERALTSYIKGTTRNGSEIEYVVFDDSKDAGARRASLEVARRIRRQFDVEVRFAGYEERAAYVRRLCEYSSTSAEVLERGVLLSSGYTLGQNRNALLLDSAGTLFLGADDDTICAPALPTGADEGGLRLCAGADPSDYWCFRNFEEAREWVRFVETDLLEAHERLLGRNVIELEAGGVLENINNRPPDIRLSERVGSSGSTVKITLNGLLGDCAWGTPFGLWHEPMGYLAFEGASLERLTSSEEFYRQAILSRQLLRVTTGPVLSDLSLSMLTVWGLDNREVLPPNLPNHRGQDLVFGQILWKCFNEAVCGHVPLALIHDPIPPRRFWPGELTRSAAGVDLCRVVIEAFRLCEFRDHEATPALRLKALGRHLVGLSELPEKALGERLKERLYESNRRFERAMRERAQEVLGRAAYYADDVVRFLEKLRMSEAREDYWIPLDMFSIDGLAAAGTRVRLAFRQFGELIERWPSIIQAAKILRHHGVRVSVPV